MLYNIVLRHSGDFRPEIFPWKYLDGIKKAPTFALAFEKQTPRGSAAAAPGRAEARKS